MARKSPMEHFLHTAREGKRSAWLDGFHKAEQLLLETLDRRVKAVLKDPELAPDDRTWMIENLWSINKAFQDKAGWGILQCPWELHDHTISKDPDTNTEIA